MKPEAGQTGPASRSVMAPGDPRGRPLPGDIVRGPLGWGRETVESIVVAFTLALLFRAFEAEAFVIPTGSMAPTLMGRHKDLACESCSRPFRVGCSAEEDDQSQSLRMEQTRLERELKTLKSRMVDRFSNQEERETARRRVDLLESDRGPINQLRTRLAGKLVPAARCPNCGHETRLVTETADGLGYDPRYPSFNGDRILVSKYAYDLADPKRWDVVVFKYPEDAKTNYIKRLVGLPGETVSIVAGDIWINRGDEPAAIARKPSDTMRAMLQVVHDSRYVSPELRAAGWPTAWSDWSRSDREVACRWRSDDEGRSFAVSCPEGDDAATLRFRHLLPTAEVWNALQAGEPVEGKARPRLIDDFQPYNAIATRPHWVGDLAVEFQLKTLGQSGSLSIDLVEAGVAHRCQIDLSTGEARLAIAGVAAADAAKARTRIRGKGSWKLLFANVDDELTLFVDDRKVEFDRPAVWAETIDEAAVRQPYDGEIEPGMNGSGDLTPVGIRVTGAAVQVADLRVLRDLYYIGALDVGTRPGELIERDRLEFPLLEDQFLVLGDNSAASKDSRMWIAGHHVDRELLIGRAMAIFWPHAIPAQWSIPVKIGGFQLRLPSWPNFARMGTVR